MKVANIIVAHKNPNQLLRLINQYDSELFHNFVHIDGRCNFSEFRQIAEHPAVTMLSKRRKLVWAGYGFVQVTLDALYTIKKRPEKFFYISLISGMDFPIRPTQEFYQFLLASYAERKEFFEILDLSVWPGAHRFERYHLAEWTIKGRYFTERMINKFIPKRQFFGGKLIPYGRAAWFTATDDFINYGLKYLEEHPDFIRFLHTVWSPDEFIWNTLIMNSPLKKNIADHYLRHIDWSEGVVSPKVYSQDDLKVLLNSGSFLGRKFDETIDETIIREVEAAIAKKD